MIAALTLAAGAVLVYSLLARRLSSTAITAPLFFVAVGLVAGPGLGLVEPAVGTSVLVPVLEAALVMVLFADAADMNLRRWTAEPSLSGRLLGIGLPLTMVLGALVALVLVPGIELWQAALVGVILAPTDAALGQAVVANERVPAVIRNALNVESGLNDGLALPFVTIFLTIGLVSAGAESDLQAGRTLVLALGGSTLIGLACGLGGGWLVRRSADLGLGGRRWQPIALAALAIGTFLIADGVEASGFLAVWVAGLCAGWMTRGHVEDEAFHLPEQLADVLTAIAFMGLGAAFLGPVLARTTPTTVLYAVLSLTVVRMVPVAVSMLRTGLAPQTLVYVGWFGPRGLASIVFASIVVEAAVPEATTMADVVLLTVTFSIIVHGVTSAWGARRYAAWFERAVAADPGIPEAVELAAPSVHGRSARRS
jgi:sodium/hydrogen antiporter